VIANYGVRVRNYSKAASEQDLIEIFKNVTTLVVQLASLVGSLRQ
jgi:hypothetical protein